VIAVFKRELHSYFTGPIAYIFCGIYLLVTNLCFYYMNIQNYSSDTSSIFLVAIIALMILIPLMTMRLWSEEKRQRTDQLLLTAPVTTTAVVMGKFLSALVVLAVSMLLTLVQPLIVTMHGTPQMGMIVGNYVALFLAASAYIAISMFFSSLTKSQLVAALCSILALVMFLLMDMFAVRIEIAWVANTLTFLSIVSRFANLLAGVFSLSDIFYFVSLTALFIFLTSRVIEKQRWS